MRFIRSQTTLLAGLLVLVAGVTGRAQGQAATITGKVTSDVGTPLQGANVYISELNISVGTNETGTFTINVPAARVSGQSVELRVRSVGFVPIARPITVRAGSQTQNFELKQDINRLSEVVVTGVTEGTERAKVPFAVGRITTADLPVPALDPIKALAGKVAGLRVAQTSGAPGSSPEIMLRGPTSINGAGRGQGPLIIVDGVIMNNSNPNELGGLDIESVEVVKGAAGASLYGTRAANGVITITTKRGASGGDGVRFNARSEFGYSDMNSINYGQPINHQLILDETGKRFCVVSGANVSPCSRTVDWMKEIMRINSVNADTVRTNQTIQNAVPAVPDLLNTYQSQIWPDHYYNILAQFVRPNPTTLQSLDATGKLGDVRFFVSGSLADERGAIRDITGNQQRRARVNLDYNARKDLTFSFSTLYDRGLNDNRNGNAFFGQALRGEAAGTNFLARDTLGRPIVKTGGGGMRSATGNGGLGFLYDLEQESDYNKSQRFVGSVTSRYFPKEWLTFEGTFGYDRRDRREDYYAVKGYRTTTISTSLNNGQESFDHSALESMNGSLTATLRKQLRSDLDGKISFRGIYDQNSQLLDGSGGQVFNVKDIFTTTNLTTNKTATSSSELVKNVGALSTATLDFKDRYTLDGTFRYDGSSKFGAGNRYAPYYRISGVWQVSKEPFWHWDFLSDFRLRGSRGTAGNPPRFSAQYETYNIASSGITLGQAGNSKLRPEVTTENEFGADFTLFGKLGIEATRAIADTKDQILLVNTPLALGFAQQWQNAGTLANRTWELSANLPVVTKRNFSWNMRGTWDRTRTYITELFAPEYVTDGGTGQGTGSFFFITARTDLSNGYQMNQYGNIWGRKFYKSCGDLPASVQPQCGDGKAYQVNDAGYVVWVGDGNSWRDGITRNLWETRLEAKDSPWNFPLYFGHPITDRPLRGQPGEGVGINQIIGNTLPKFRMTWNNTVTFKRLSAYVLLDGTFGHSINNQGEGWGLLDFSSANFDQQGKSVETAKPVGYSWRAGSPESTGTGGFYDTLNPNNYVVEDGSYAKLREVSLTYRLGRIAGIGDWTAGLVGRNLLTFTHYSGLDPEVGATGGNNQTGSGLINQTDAFGFPTLRTFTFSLSTRF